MENNCQIPEFAEGFSQDIDCCYVVGICFVNMSDYIVYCTNLGSWLSITNNPVQNCRYVLGTCLVNMADYRVYSTYLGSWLSIQIPREEWKIQVYEKTIMHYRQVWRICVMVCYLLLYCPV